MATLCINQRGARLDYDRGAIAIRESAGRAKSVPLTMVDRLVVIGNVHLTARLMTRLAERGAGVTFMPGRGASRATFLHAPGHGDVTRRLGQYRLLERSACRALWAQRLVWLRLSGQHRLLAGALRARADRRRVLVTAQARLRRGMVAVRGGDHSMESLRGYEGAASAAYFHAYKALFPASLGFIARRRRPPPDPVNAALSLGYTLAHSDALKAITAAGLEPMFGVLHEIAYSRESLACDFTELVRVRVERLIWRLFAEQSITAASFTADGGGVRLRKSSRSTFFSAYERMAVVHRRWLSRAVHRFAGACAGLGQSVEPAERNRND